MVRAGLSDPDHGARQHRPAVPDRLRERAPQVEREVRVAVVGEAAGEPVRLIGHRFQNPCDGMRNARLKREDAFSHAMIIVSSAMVSSSWYRCTRANSSSSTSRCVSVIASAYSSATF